MSEAPQLFVILGHAGSGKSRVAEAEVLGRGGRPVYVATAQAWDDEMRAKVAEHAARRGPEWRLVERPADLAAACAGAAAGEEWLIDCATMWLTERVLADAPWEAEAEAWIAAMRGAAGRFVVVSNDVGGGVTPDNALARRFQRAQGALNRRLAAAAGRVALVTAGLSQVLK
jgi:adenosylcobinamide kinase/adenosylcobinamide-phosphate guanylyltransferase